ncbi:MAG: HAD family hydrolase [Alphaproteobacteria bacterium]|nr:HAD family hydrolase [Alphaproteobacteria bacterium]
MTRLEIRNPERFSEPPLAVIFDTDNTLYHYDPPHRKAMSATETKAAKLLGVGEIEFRDAFKTARRIVKDRLGYTASSHSRLLYFQRAVELLGLKTQVLITLDLEQTYWRTFLAHSELFPGVRNFILALRAEGIHTAIITDLTSQIQFRKIVYFGLDDCFDYVVTSEEAGVEKPAPEPFELALEKLGAPPEKTWIIGDDPVTDIEGARNFNMTILQKRHEGVVVRDAENGPDLVFNEFPVLYKFLMRKGWIGG